MRDIGNEKVNDRDDFSATYFLTYALASNQKRVIRFVSPFFNNDLFTYIILRFYVFIQKKSL